MSRLNFSDVSDSQSIPTSLIINVLNKYNIHNENVIVMWRFKMMQKTHWLWLWLIVFLHHHHHCQVTTNTWLIVHNLKYEQVILMNSSANYAFNSLAIILS